MSLIEIFYLTIIFWRGRTLVQLNMIMPCFIYWVWQLAKKTNRLTFKQHLINITVQIYRNWTIGFSRSKVPIKNWYVNIDFVPSLTLSTLVDSWLSFKLDDFRLTTLWTMALCSAKVWLAVMYILLFLSSRVCHFKSYFYIKKLVKS